MTISVALGTHNGARYLEEQLRSILAQTRPVDEIVLSDDASTDGTVELAERVVAAHDGPGARPVLTVLRNASALGVTANFARALAEASGELIALCDQDDVWRPDRIARAVAELDARPDADLVGSDAQLVDAEGEPLEHTLFQTLGVTPATVTALRERPLPELLRRNLLTGATMLVRRELVTRAAPFPASWVHDEWLAMVAAATSGVAVVAEPLIDYRQHGANQIGVTRLALSGRLGRLRMPRTARNARLLARIQDLVERMPQLAPGDGAAMAAVIDKLGHEQVRSALPVPRLRRVVPVLRELRTGRYTAYGLGAQDVLRDVVQPI